MYNLKNNFALYKHKNKPLLFLKVIEDAPGIGLFDIFLITRIANSLEDGFNEYNPEVIPDENNLEFIRTFEYMIEIDVFYNNIFLEKKLFTFDLDNFNELIENLANKYTFKVSELRNQELQDCSYLLQKHFPELIF